MSLTFNLGFLLAKPQPLSFDLCRDFVAHFDHLYQADPKKNPNPMRMDRKICIKITTESWSYSSLASGHIKVYVDIGFGYTLESSATTVYTYDAPVLNECFKYKDFKGLQVQGGSDS